MPKYGVCPLSLLPLRAEPRQASEMVSQLLWGECYEILETELEWLKIKSFFDGYEAWLDRKQAQYISEKQWAIFTACTTFCPVPVQPLNTPPKYYLMGSPLIYSPQGIATQDKLKMLEQSALGFLDAPYLWGGRSVFGVDCSGLAQIVYRMAGVLLPRDAYQQAEKGNAVPFGEHQFGDLAFFKNPKGRITHVGIVWRNGQILHASGKVRIDLLDEVGILIEDYYTHQLSHIQRFF